MRGVINRTARLIRVAQQPDRRSSPLQVRLRRDSPARWQNPPCPVAESTEGSGATSQAGEGVQGRGSEDSSRTMCFTSRLTPFTAFVRQFLVARCPSLTGTGYRAYEATVCIKNFLRECVVLNIQDGGDKACQLGGETAIITTLTS